MIQRLVNRQRLPRLAKIKLGVTVTQPGRDGKMVSFPKETDYFVVPPELSAIYGDRPKSLPILFPSDAIDKVLPNRYERYSGGLLTLDCDGVNAMEIPVRGPEVRFACKRPASEPGKPTPACECGARAKGALNVIVMGGGIGTYQVMLGGEQRIADLLNQLDVYLKIFGSLTQINGHPIPFAMVRVPTQAQIRKGDAANGERITREGYPVKLECRFTVEQALEARGMRLLEAASGGLPKALPSSGEVDRAHQHEQPSLLDDHPDDVIGDDAAPGSIESMRADLEGMFLDAAGGRRQQALNLTRKACMQHLGRAIDSLADLDEHELRQMLKAMSQ